MLFPTTLVGSYPQPDWLIDRAMLAGRFPPRVRARELWRVPEPWLARRRTTRPCSRSARRKPPGSTSSPTARSAARATPTASPPRSRARLDNPGTALDRTGHPNPVPRVVGPIRRMHAGRGARTCGSCARTRTGDEDHRARAVHHGPAGAERLLPERRRARRSTTPPPSTRRSRDLFAAGADVVQIDEPYMQARPRRRGSIGLKALNRALDGVSGDDRGAHLLRLRRHHPRAAAGYSFLPELADCRVPSRSRSRRRSRSSTARCSTQLPDKQIMLGVLDLSTRTWRRRDGGRADPSCAAATCAPSSHPVAPDCGMKYLPRDVAFGKLKAMVAAARSCGRSSAAEPAPAIAGDLLTLAEIQSLRRISSLRGATLVLHTSATHRRRHDPLYALAIAADADPGCRDHRRPPARSHGAQCTASCTST